MILQDHASIHGVPELLCLSVLGIVIVILLATCLHINAQHPVALVPLAESTGRCRPLEAGAEYAEVLAVNFVLTWYHYSEYNYQFRRQRAIQLLDERLQAHYQQRIADTYPTIKSLGRSSQYRIAAVQTRSQARNWDVIIDGESTRYFSGMPDSTRPLRLVIRLARTVPTKRHPLALTIVSIEEQYDRDDHPPTPEEHPSS